MGAAVTPGSCAEDQKVEPAKATPDLGQRPEAWCQRRRPAPGRKDDAGLPRRGGDRCALASVGTATGGLRWRSELGTSDGGGNLVLRQRQEGVGACPRRRRDSDGRLLRPPTVARENLGGGAAECGFSW
jgi:hypothetical protein